MNQGDANTTKLPASIASYLRRRPYCSLYKVPGRVNIIGEHTDYNEGWVLPFASSQHLLFAVEPGGLQQWSVTSGRFNESIALPLQDCLIRMDHWSRYFAAVLHTADAHKLPVGGLEIFFDGDLPHGGGLSSSSAITCAILFILNDQCGWGLNLLDLAKLARESEHRTGVKGGIMDQFTILHAIEGEALMLDCRHLIYEKVSMPESAWQWILFNSGVNHDLKNTAYNERRKTCERVVSKAKLEGMEIEALRDMSMAELSLLEFQLTAEEYDIATFVLRENHRVHLMLSALKEANFKRAGVILNESHLGLKEDFKVTEPTVDFMVQLLNEVEGVAGARMIGGGFGGCVLGLVHEAEVSNVVTYLTTKFEDTFGRMVPWHITFPSDGIRIIKSEG